MSANNLAIVLYSQSKFAEAEVLYRRAFTERERTLGADHIDTLNSANGLEELLRMKGGSTEPDIFFRDRCVLAGEERVPGPSATAQ